MATDTKKLKKEETMAEEDVLQELVLPSRQPPPSTHLKPHSTITIRSNCYRITFKDTTFHRYEARFFVQNPHKTKDLSENVKNSANAEERRLLIIHLYNKLRKEHREIFKEKAKYIFDCSCTLIAPEELAIPSDPIDLDPESIDSERRASLPRTITRLYVIMKYIGEIQLDSASIRRADELEMRDRSPIQILELIYNQHIIFSDKWHVFPQKSFLKESCSRDRYSEIQGRVLKEGLVKGVRSSGDDPENPQLMMVADVRKTAFFAEENLGDYLKKWFDVRSTDDLKDKLREKQYLDKITKELKNLTLMTTHLKKNRIFRCNGIDKVPARERTFTIGATPSPDHDDEGPTAKKSKKECSVYDYYKERYKMDFRFKNYPCILEQTTERGTKNKVLNFYLLDVLKIVGGQTVPLQKMDKGFQEKMIKQCCMKPQEAFEAIDRLTRQAMLAANNPDAPEYGCTMESKPIELTADVLHPPALRFKNNQKIEYDNNSKVSQPPQNRQFLINGSCNKWLMINYRKCVTEREADDFGREFLKALRARGTQIPEYDLRSPKSEEEIFDLAKRKQASFILFITTRPDGDKLHNIMKRFELESKIVTQHINNDKCKSAPKQRITMENFIMKTNEKLGGTNFRITSGQNFIRANQSVNREAAQLLDQWLGNNRIFIGIDLSNTASDVTKTVVGISYNYDSDTHAMTGFPFYTDAKSSVIQNLERYLMRPMMDFKERSKNKTWPSHLIIYRGGVSEGDYLNVIAREKLAIKAFLRMLREKYNAPKIGFTFVTAQRQHKFRFGPATGSSEQSSSGRDDRRDDRGRDDNRGRDDRGRDDRRDYSRGGGDRDYSRGRDQRGDYGGRGGGGFQGGRGGGNGGGGFQQKLPIGVCITQSITDPTKEQFIMQSHTAFQGTPKMVIYTVIADEPKRMPLEELIYVTHSLCFAHGSVTSPVSRPSYLYWAGEIAKRGTNNLRVELDQRGDTLDLTPEDLSERLNVTLNCKFFS